MVCLHENVMILLFRDCSAPRLSDFTFLCAEAVFGLSWLTRTIARLRLGLLVRPWVGIMKKGDKIVCLCVVFLQHLCPYVGLRVRLQLAVYGGSLTDLPWCLVAEVLFLMYSFFSIAKESTKLSLQRPHMEWVWCDASRASLSPLSCVPGHILPFFYLSYWALSHGQWTA